MTSRVIPRPSNPLLSLGVNHTNMNTIQSLCEFTYSHNSNSIVVVVCIIGTSLIPRLPCSGMRLQYVYHFGITPRIQKAIHIPHWG